VIRLRISAATDAIISGVAAAMKASDSRPVLTLA